MVKAECSLAHWLPPGRLGIVTTSTKAEPAETTRVEPSCPQTFVTTHWSVVLSAATSDTTQAHDALAKLCQTYWHPLYTYVRRRGYSPEDAEDFTQGFFASLLQRNAVSSVSPEK